MIPHHLDFHTQLFTYVVNCKLVFFQLEWTTQENENEKQAKKKKILNRTAFPYSVVISSLLPPHLQSGLTNSHSLTQTIPPILLLAESWAKTVIRINWNSETKRCTVWCCFLEKGEFFHDLSVDPLARLPRQPPSWETAKAHGRDYRNRRGLGNHFAGTEATTGAGRESVFEQYRVTSAI